MRFIFYRSEFPIQLESIIVTEISNPDGTKTAAIEGVDEILSWQPDRTWQTRHINAVGPWEKYLREGNIATFNSNGTVGHFAMFQIPN